ncbi:uncharacterized protein LY79DRAFT_36388 [Colletotrichum navitas]|uniref:Uncharacterized protein n=1 Tax=Colletotrichum navitas TaxID=681940 RepID=A0AAD8V9M2_9PEZI|nr:uncharacterized protein LY79DRAFT_36388 [Colletotrichum navitas]KAK1596946.1 hypothetical protein LY79DRAFT_36388 [Colletotrichum navitas]
MQTASLTEKSFSMLFLAATCRGTKARRRRVERGRTGDITTGEGVHWQEGGWVWHGMAWHGGMDEGKEGEERKGRNCPSVCLSVRVEEVKMGQEGRRGWRVRWRGETSEPYLRKAPSLSLQRTLRLHEEKVKEWMVWEAVREGRVYIMSRMG